MADPGVAPPGDGSITAATRGTGAVAALPGFDQELSALLSHAALLRAVDGARRSADELPPLPPRPTAPRSSLAPKAALAAVVIAACLLVVEGLNAAEFLFGSPP